MAWEGRTAVINLFNEAGIPSDDMEPERLDSVFHVRRTRDYSVLKQFEEWGEKLQPSVYSQIDRSLIKHAAAMKLNECEDFMEYTDWVGALYQGIRKWETDQELADDLCWEVQDRIMDIRRVGEDECGQSR